MEQNNPNNRREFVKKAVVVGAFVTLGGIGAVIVPKLKASAIFLRPPGAVDENDFMATCIKCGQCVQVCPYHTLSLLDINQGHLVGTPFVDARERGCYLCDLLPCVLACPSGALDHRASEAEDVKMGIAFLKRADTCFAFRGENVKKEDLARILNKRALNEREQKVLDDYAKYEDKPCTICADMCPFPEKENAIIMIQDSNNRWSPHIKDACVGCGVCEELCPSKEASIVVIPRVSYSQFYKGQK